MPRRLVSLMPAVSDCEALRDAFLGQPVNAFTSLAFVITGISVLRSRPALAWLSIAAGAGSFLFHGPMPEWAEWAHDLTLAMLLAGLVLEAKPPLIAIASVALGVGFALYSSAAEPVTLVLAVVAGTFLVRQLGADPQRTRLHAAALMAVAGLVAVLSQTGGPLCNPDSLLQGHGVWHVLAAGALWLWLQTARVPVHGIP